MFSVAVIKEFKDFILKGNAVSLAVGVIIGAAFGKVVTALTEGIIQPLISLLGGDAEVSLQIWIFDVGLLINAAISLIITGAVVFFLFIRPMNKLQAREVPPPPAEPPPQEKLLAEIRDLLREKAN